MSFCFSPHRRKHEVGISALITPTIPLSQEEQEELIGFSWHQDKKNGPARRWKIPLCSII
jgi:hypothetical protein